MDKDDASTTTSEGPSPFVVLKNSSASAKIYTFGAHISSFQVDNAEKLWMSSLSCRDGSGPIRGGIPIAFPQVSFCSHRSGTVVLLYAACVRIPL